MKLTKSSTKPGLTAVKLRLVLSIAILAVAASGIGLFIYGSSILDSYADEVQLKVSQAEESQNILSRLEATEIALQSQSEAVQRAAEVVAESRKYQYQDQIILDLNAYASRAGMDIRSISFNSEADSTTSSSSATAATPPTAGADRPAATTGPTLKSVSATIDLYTPVNYRDFLTFMSYIEQNLTKMQIQNISLQKSSEGSGVTVQSLTIEVYTR